MLLSARCPETRGMGKQGWAECAAEASAGVNVGTKAHPGDWGQEQHTGRMFQKVS